VALQFMQHDWVMSVLDLPDTACLVLRARYNPG
jgi:hypothetical protein